ncbi:MAG: ferredoxin--NADP reductase [Deltaproteobacteria bacterium]|nr:ferredoxin--NADP reductase [Deltaproteobacteria bacterium]
MGMLLGGLLGRNRPSPPFAASPLAPRTLRVDAIRRETADVVTLVLRDPVGRAIKFSPGQYFTVLVSVGGETVRRAYSASMPQGEGEHAALLALTIKRIPAGRVSNFLNDNLRVGDTLEVIGPQGNFVVPRLAPPPQELVLVAGGCGITPLMCIARAHLRNELNARVSLIYGNRRREDIIFHQALIDLQRDHEHQLAVIHVLGEPPAAWNGRVGILDRHRVAQELDTLNPSPGTHYFACGPVPMLVEVRAALAARGVPETHVHEERFVRPSPLAQPTPCAGTPQAVTIRRGGVSQVIRVKPGQSILEAGLESGLAMPFSCTMGGCGACKLRVVDGQVDMDEPNCLSPAERADGFVLACVGRPRGLVTLEIP